jgi:hypothetical protein
MNAMNLGILILIISISISCSKITNQELSSQISNEKTLIQIHIEGKAQKGYFLGIAPYLIGEDYRSEDYLYWKLKAYFDYAKGEEVFLADRSVLTFPEHIGTWNVFMGEEESLLHCQTIMEAMEDMRIKHIVRYMWEYLFERSYSVDRKMETVFRMKGFQMATSYQNIFSRLASEYRVGIVAGSILLPQPKVIEGKITVTDGPIENVSFFFHSDGSVDPQIKRMKVAIEDKETNSNPIFYTQIGNLSIHFNGENWNEQYDETDVMPSLLAIPGLSMTELAWSDEWIQSEDLMSNKTGNYIRTTTIANLEKWKKKVIRKKESSETNLNIINIFSTGKILGLEPTGDALLIKQGRFIQPLRKKEKGIGKIYALGI